VADMELDVVVLDVASDMAAVIMVEELSII
jgi:hypothetical protein